MSISSTTFLITTPDFDDVVFYCSRWSDEIIEEAEKKGFNVINLPKDKANRDNFEGHIRKQKPKFVMFNGHGSPNEIGGHKNEILLEKGKNEQLMKERIIYARSCFALKELGEACVKCGALGFISYALPFSFISDPNRSAHPLKDELAKPCLLTSNMIPIAIIKGQTISEAVEKAKAKMDELIRYWETRTDLVEAQFVASCLHWNMIGLGFKGDPHTKLSV